MDLETGITVTLEVGFEMYQSQCLHFNVVILCGEE